MSSALKAKGTRWESALVGVLNDFAGAILRRFRAYRPAQGGRKDVGDVHGVSPFVIQAKDDRSFRISEWLDGPKGVRTQAENAAEPYGVVVVKRARRPIGAAYAIQRFDDWIRVLVRLRRAENLLEHYAPAAAREHFDLVDEECGEEIGGVKP